MRTLAPWRECSLLVITLRTIHRSLKRQEVVEELEAAMEVDTRSRWPAAGWCNWWRHCCRRDGAGTTSLAGGEGGMHDELLGHG
jgi:hypothetical protein